MRRGQRGLGAFPHLVRADALLGAERQHDVDVVEAEDCERLVHHVDEGRHLALHLIGPAEDMRVVLGEAAHPSQAVGDAGPFVSVEPPEVGETHRQVAVRVQRRAVDQRVAGAVHRLHPELALVDLDEEHVLLVVLVVPRAPPQARLEDLRRHDLLVPVALVQLPDVVDEEVVEDRPLGQEKRARGRGGVEHEQFELAPNLPVVALGGLLQHLDVLAQGVLRLERRPVDALEHGVALVAAPIGPRYVE